MYRKNEKIFLFSEEEERAYISIKALRKQEKYEEAEKVGKQFPNNAKIQSQLMKVYILQSKVKDGEDVAERFPEDDVIQSQLVTLYQKSTRIEDAIRVGEKYPNEPAIQSQMISIYLKRHEYDKVKKIGERFPTYQTIQSQLVTMYIKNGEYEEAKKIGDRFPRIQIIQSQMITLYRAEGNLKKAREIGEMFPNNRVIQIQISGIGQKLKKCEKNEDIKDLLIETESILNLMRENPKLPRISEYIENLDDKWIKTILNSALAEKIGMKEPAQQFIKKLKKEGLVDEEHKQLVNSLDQRLQQKKIFFNIDFYTSLINKTLHPEKIVKKEFKPEFEFTDDDEERI